MVSLDFVFIYVLNTGCPQYKFLWSYSYFYFHQIDRKKT